MAFNASLHTASNKPYGVTDKPVDARTYYYDEALFKYRPYVSTAEVLTYLSNTNATLQARVRQGQFPIIVNTGGTLSNGVITGGTNSIYWFKDGVTDGDLVEMALGGGGVTSYNDLTDKPTLGTAAALNVAATGDAATGDVVKGDDSRLTNSRTPTAHTHTASEVTDFQTAVNANTKLLSIQDGATANDTDANLKNRANHTGTQSADTITDGVTNKVVTQGEKDSWNGKQDALGFTPISANSADTLTNKTLDGSNNTFQNIPQSAVIGLESTINNISVIQRTGGVVAFDRSAIYNTPDAPGTFSSFDFTGAVDKTEVVGFFNNGAEPSWGTGVYRIGDAWNTNQLNQVRFIYVASNKAIAQIISSQGSTTNIDTRVSDLLMTTNSATTSTTATDLTELTMPVQANSEYIFEIQIRCGCSGTGGLNVGFNAPSGASIAYSRTGGTNSTTIISSTVSAIGVGAVAFAAQAGADYYSIIMKGRLKVGATAGNFTPQYKSVTAGQTSTIYSDLTFMTVKKVA